jgi:beta-glucanase (GH16 family)
VRVRPFINGQAYTSGCITTELTHAQTYGYFEMAAKLPLGKGFWPAFWLLPKGPHWPPEIDIFECSGARRMSVRPGFSWPTASGRDGYGEWVDGLIDIADGFHVYALEWTRERLVFFVDGTEILSRPNPGIHEDMYILVNLALGSADPFWIPDPDATTPFPGLLQIDYIHAWRRG